MIAKHSSMDEFHELSSTLHEQGIGVRVKQPYSKAESDEVRVERYVEDETARANLEMLIAMYLSEGFKDFDQWMQAKAPVLGRTRDHHSWILAKVDEMRRLARQCEALEPATAAVTTLRNLLHEAD